MNKYEILAGFYPKPEFVGETEAITNIRTFNGCVEVVVEAKPEETITGNITHVKTYERVYLYSIATLSLLGKYEHTNEFEYDNSTANCCSGGCCGQAKPE